MKLHLNLSLRRAVLAAMAAVATFASTATAGIVDTRYDLQYYLDFSRNAGAFAAGATNVQVGYSDGSASFTIPLMPYLGSFAQVSESVALSLGSIATNGGAALVSPQFVYGAEHVFSAVKSKFDKGQLCYTFSDENGSPSSAEVYSAVNIDNFGHDGGVSRTSKLVTAVAYTPMATDAFMSTLDSSTWLYRLGNGGYWDSTGSTITTGNNAIGGIINMDSYKQQANGDWYLYGVFRENSTEKDPKTPLDTGVFSGDSGSPLFAWDEDQERFVFVGALWASNLVKGFGNDVYARFNPTLAQAAMDKYTINATFSGTDTIAWSASDTATGEGTLTQGATVINYTGKGSANAMAATKGLSFATDSEQQQVIQLQGNVNMGAGALTFTKGDWKLTEAADYTLSSAGFEVQKGASLTLELAGAAGEEIRKVGEGTMTIAGSGNNEASLVVGGGTVVYDVEYKDGKIAGCTLGNAGETRLNRQNGYAASSVRLEGGVAIIVLMGDGQFKTNTVGGDTFTFGNDGGLLNMNGHNLEWGVIQQDDSGKGARIGNFTPLGEKTPGLATFTYTGSGQFDGCFVDESNAANDGKAQLAVVYKGGANDSWKLTGNNTNVGGYTVQSGTMVLEGIKTHHVWKSDANDWTFASIEGSNVTVKNGAAFQLSHHAQLVGDVVVEDGGNFVMNEVVQAASESVAGSAKTNMAGKEVVSLVGNVTLKGNNSLMTADISSPAVTVLRGDISVENYDYNGKLTTSFIKKGSGVLYVDGNVNLPGGLIESGGLAIGKTDKIGDWYQWTVAEKGFFAACGMKNETALNWLTSTSSGVFALTSNQDTELILNRFQNGLYIGAWGDVSYGTSNDSLTAYNGAWRLGGGTGTLTVNFKLQGANTDLIIGNDSSSGTVHLTNTENVIRDIYIKGTGNKLTYDDKRALGGAYVSLSYGNAFALYDAKQLEIVKAGVKGVLALDFEKNQSLDMRGTNLALGANSDYTYTGALTVDKTYRFGGSGNLTVDTELDGSKSMVIDGQNTSGSSVTLARENAFSGDIVVGGALEYAAENTTGDIALHVGHSSALAEAKSINLQKGANLYTDGQNLMVQNLSAQTGSSISNNGNDNSTVVLRVTGDCVGENAAYIADGVLNDQYNAANLTLVKAGAGTLKMEANSNWSGGLVIEGGKVVVKTSGDTTAAGGIGSTNNTVFVGDGAVLRVEAAKRAGYKLYGTRLVQTVTGTGTIELASGGAAVLTSQGAAFEGTVHVMDNTRLYMSSELVAGQTVFNNLSALNKADIKVDSGSQVRVTTNLQTVSNTLINAYSDFYISGYGFAGSDSGLVQSRLNDGALAIDCAATVWGNVTLLADASISSSSYDPTNTKNYPGYSLPYNCTDTYSALGLNQHYGVKGALGGTIRGRILSDNHAELTIQGNEGITITADSDNTFGDLKIAGGLILNKGFHDGFALRLDGGKAVSQTSTALGTGHVTLNDGLVLRLAGTGVANQTSVEYTYANNISAGEGSTIQSYNITNKLTGTVTAAGTLNLATAQGGVLNLAGGVSGSGALNIGADSKVILGDGVTFGGNAVAEAGADFTLESVASLATTSTITGTDSLTLHLGGTSDYTLGGITMNGADSALTLHFDFTQAGLADYTTLNSSITSSATTIAIDLNMFNDITEGSYTLISGSLGNTTYTLADTYGDRLSLVVDNGTLTLQVGAEGRLYWAADSASHVWNNTDNNWLTGNKGEKKAYSGTAEVMLTSSGLSTAGTRESISVSDTLTVGKVNVSSLYELKGEGSLSGKKLGVGAGGDLKLGVNATFTEGVQVNDGTLTVEGKSLTANVSAENGAEVNLNGATLKGDVTVGSESAVNMDAASMTGVVSTPASGAISLTNAKLSGTFSTDSGATVLKADKLVLSEGTFDSSAQLEAGSIAVAGGSFTLKGASDIETLAVNAGQTAMLYNADENSGTSKKIGVLQLGDNAKLTIDNRGSNTSESGAIGTLQVGGAATIQETYNSGHLTIDTLMLADGVASGTLNLYKSSSNGGASHTTVFDIGSATAPAGNFAGEVVLANTASHSGNPKHSAFINLYGKETLAHAVVKMNEQKDGKAYLGLGINANNARIGGLESSSALGDRVLLFSGYAQQDMGWNTDDGPNKNGDEVARTLIIDTAKGAEYTYHGQVRETLSLVKDGSGKQTFSGASSAFNGSIEILNGTLAFTGDALGMLSAASSVTVSGGVLDISSYDFNSGNSLSINNFSFSENAVLALGNLQADTTYTLFDSMMENWMTLTKDNFVINGISLSSIERDVSLSLGLDGSFSYSIDSWDLSWNGGASGTWSVDSSNAVWQTTRLDSTTGEESTFNTGFTNLDSVSIAGTPNSNNTTTVTLGSDIMVSTMNVTSGSVVVKDPGEYGFRADTVNVAAGAQLQMRNVAGSAGADNAIGKLVLGNNAIFSTYNESQTTDATHIGTLQLNGSAGVLRDNANSGYIAVDTLNMGAGLSSSMLKLEKYADSTIASLFEFGSAGAAAGNFVGEVELRGHASGVERSAFIIISGDKALAGAHIDLAATNSGSAYLGLGINTANATIAGLESSGMTDRAKLFSGTIGTQKIWSSSNSTAPDTVSDATRTLTINTAEGKSYTFSGEVVSGDNGKLNLVKEGKGTQSFMGTGKFGNVTVNNGTLMLGGSMQVAGTMSGEGTLAINSKNVTLNSGSKSISVNIAVEKGAKLSFGATDNLDYTAQRTLTVKGDGTQAGTGVIDFGSTRQTMGGWTLELHGGEVKGTGEATYGAIDYHKSMAYVNALSGDSSISAITRLRGEVDGNGTRIGRGDITYKVAKDASLNVSGKVHTDKRHEGGIIKIDQGTLHLNNQDNDLDKILVQGGTANIHGAEVYTLAELQAATKVDVGFYVGATKDTTTKSSVTVTGKTLLGGGATLNTSLTLADGATLDMDNLDAGAVTLNGALTFGGKVQMGNDLLATVGSMSGYQSLVLFTGLTGNDPLTSMTADAEGLVQASEVFSNMQNNQVYVSYQVIDNVGSLMVVHVPEPTTTTLSLLALSALAARRRRK